MALDFQSSRTLSLSQAGRGGALLNDTVILNPSMLGFQPVASFSGTFNWLNNAQAVDDAEKTYNVSVIDGKNPYVNAGISFTRRADLDFIHMAVAKRVLPWLSVGLLGKRYSSRSNTRAALGQSISGIEAGASLAVAIPPSVLAIPTQIGITADNLIHKRSDEASIGPRQLGIGLKTNISALLMLYGDYVQNFSHFSGAYPTLAGGVEIAVVTDIFVRGGLFGYRETGWSVGGGWVGPKLGISYGYQSRRQKADRSFEHAVTMDLYM